MSNISLSIIVPVYNEESSILPFLEEVQKNLKNIEKYEIIFCLDPSTDNTEEIIQKQAEINKNIKLIICPIVKSKSNKPNCSSGTLKNSITNLKIE